MQCPACRHENPAQAILAARIDRLAPKDKSLLQAASVIGKDVPFTLLQAIADVPEHSLCRGLIHLQAAEFLYEAGQQAIILSPSGAEVHALLAVTLNFRAGRRTGWS
jgi:predicted ATPase